MLRIKAMGIEQGLEFTPRDFCILFTKDVLGSRYTVAATTEPQEKLEPIIEVSCGFREGDRAIELLEKLENMKKKCKTENVTIIYNCKEGFE